MVHLVSIRPKIQEIFWKNIEIFLFWAWGWKLVQVTLVFITISKLNVKVICSLPNRCLQSIYTSCESWLQSLMTYIYDSKG